MAEMLNALSFFDNHVNSPLAHSRYRRSTRSSITSPKQAMKQILRPRFGIILDPYHTLFADALVIRRKGTDGLLKQQII